MLYNNAFCYSGSIKEYKDKNGKPYLAYGHDYLPDLPTDGNFLNNGLVDPFRNPHPHLYEVKKVYEGVEISEIKDNSQINDEPSTYLFEIRNKYSFIDLKI